MKKILTLIVSLSIGCGCDQSPRNQEPSQTKPELTVSTHDGSSSNSRQVNKLAAVLTTGQWVKDLGEGPFFEQWVFRFYRDETYTQQIFSDFTSSPIKGKWKLEPSNAPLPKLTLSDLEAGKHYILGGETFVRYDREKDLLVVTGPRYVGEQTLRHEQTE